MEIAYIIVEASSGTRTEAKFYHERESGDTKYHAIETMIVEDRAVSDSRPDSAKRSFEDVRSQAGARERVNLALYEPYFYSLDWVGTRDDCISGDKPQKSRSPIPLDTPTDELFRLSIFCDELALRLSVLAQAWQQSRFRLKIQASVTSKELS